MSWRASEDLNRPRLRASAAIPVNTGTGGGGGEDPTLPGTNEPSTGTGSPGSVSIPHVSFRRRSKFVNENVGTTTLELQLSHSYNRTITVDISHISGTATAIRGTDWNWSGNAIAPNLQTVYFAPGITVLDVPITIIDDASVETFEVFAFTIQGATTIRQGVTVDVGIGDENLSGIIINANDTPAIPDVNLSAQFLSVQEGSSTNALLVTLSEITTVPVSGTITITPGSGATSGDYTIPTSYLVPAGESSAIIPISVATDSEIEGPETVSVELTSCTGGVLGALVECLVTLEDSTVTPIVEWTTSTMPPIVEGSSGLQFVDVPLYVSNHEQCPNHAGFTVQIQLSGTATAGVDYVLVGSALVGFAPGESARIVRFQVQGDTTIEPDETIVASLVSPDGCAVGKTNVLTGTIINDDQATGGEQLRPSIYYPSEVFHVGGETLQMVVELNEVYSSAVNIQYAVHEGPNTVSGDHGLSATGNFDITAGSLYGFLPITVPGASTTGNQKRFVVTLTGTSHGQLGVNTRFVGIILGDADTRDLIPPRPTVPGTDDIRVWANNYRISPFAVDIPIPAGVEPIGYALRHSSNQYQTMWAAKNATYPKFLQEGTPVVVRVMEDLAVSGRNKPVTLGVGQSVFDQDWIGLGNPSSGSGTQTGARDLIIIGDGGTPKSIRGITFSTSYGWSTAGLDNNPSWPTMAVDNVQFRNLRIKPPFGVYAAVQSNGNNALQKDHHGLVHIYDCVWDETDALLGGLLGDNNFRMGARMNNRMSFRVEGCTFKAHEHCFYADRMSGLCLFYNNTNPGFGTRGVGRSLIQVVHRPGEGGGGAGHGLLAIIGNTSTDNGWRAMDGAKDVSVYGFVGETYIEGNSHTGHIQEPGQNTNNRGFVGCLMTGNENGLYTFLYPLLSGFWAGFKKVRFRDATINCTVTDQWNGNPYFFNGAAFLEIGGWTVTSVPPLGSSASRACVLFNQNASASAPALVWDTQARPVASTSWSTPSGTSYNPYLFPNRPGGVSYLDGVAGAGGIWSYLTGAGNKDMGSVGQKAQHYTLSSNLATANGFQAAVTSLGIAAVNAYDGTDLY